MGCGNWDRGGRSRVMELVMLGSRMLGSLYWG